MQMFLKKRQPWWWACRAVQHPVQQAVQVASAQAARVVVAHARSKYSQQQIHSYTFTAIHSQLKAQYTMALIDARQLTKVYTMGDQTVHALHGVSLQIEAGDFVAIMGASGSGKSTLMNIMGCLDLPTAGEYFLAGEAVQDMHSDQLASIRNRRIGFVFQQFNLLPRTSALENVELPMVYSGVKAAERRAKASAALHKVGLGQRMGHTPAELSGGQQQRVAIARALVNNPQLILADEPTGALDSQTSEDIMRLLSELNAQGMTVVLVTHESDIANWARRRIVFKDGHIIEDAVRSPESTV